MDPLDSAPPAPVYGGFWRRVAAYMLDELVMLIIIVVLAVIVVVPTVILVTMLGRELDSERYASLLSTLITIPVIWLYPTLLESSKLQATLGKRALGMRVTDEHGNRVSFGRANGRFWSKALSSLVLGAGYLMVAFSQRKQGLHDRIAHTLVVRTR